MSFVKSQLETLLRGLPDDCTFEDVQYGVEILARIQRSEESILRDGTVRHDEAIARLARFLDDRK